MASEINLSNVIEIFAFGFSMVVGYVKMQVKIKELEIRLNASEKNDNKIMEKLERIGEDINDIKLDLQNKQDRA
jgi:hypothetical protein